MSDYLYTKEHEWILNDTDGAVIGITHHAQEQLGEIVYVELPEVGDSFESGDEFGSVESVKAVAEVFMPVAGEVIEINGLLDEHPEMVNNNPEESGWLVKIKLADGADLSGLMSKEQYDQFVAEEQGS
ncbi:MAG: glycine cleavage system protein GcvH [Acidobacteriota bacterium]|nr:glycine cleavage system protein GcvH [Acidobacteriota bacterium]